MSIIGKALEFLHEILLDLRGYDYIFLISDLDGNIRYSFSSGTRVLPMRAASTSLTQENMGETALALAMREKKKSHIQYCEHKNSILKNNFSLAVSFNDSEDAPIGYLVCLGNENPDLAKSLLRAFVKNIEYQMQVQNVLKNLEIKNKFENAIIKSIHDGFLVLNADCVITHANKKAAALLNTDMDELIGKRLDEIILSRLRIKRVFETGKAIVNEECFVRLPHKTMHVIKTAVPVYNDDGKVIAVIDNFKEIKEVRNLINRMVGAKASFSFDNIIFESAEMAEAIWMARTTAKISLPVLIQGESGTGKELIAHAIHNESDRKKGPFVIIDCASLPRELVESELFGYTDGSFTGAQKGGRAGKFELANGGTVFLDEIGEIPIELQAKFLRVLQSYCITRIGGSQHYPVNIRIIAATSRNLQKEVKLGNFREDLFYRLNVLTVNIPPLRKRKKDIAALALHFLRKYEVKLNKSNMRISPEAIQLLEEYHWPGNVRELENVIVRAMNLSDGLILPGHLPMNLIHARTAEPSVPAFNINSYNEMERRTIMKALKACKGNRTKAARLLGIARSTLYKKIETFGIDREDDEIIS